MTKPLRFLLTGGAGYLGSVLTKILLQRGHAVACLDNLMFSQRSPLYFCDHPKYEFVFGDVRNASLLSSLVRAHDVIVPLAAIVGMPACDRYPIEATAINLEAIAKIDEIRGSEQILIYPTTNSGYGTQSGEQYCAEETPLEPISHYGRTKVEAEKVLVASNKPSIVFRLATVFGLSPRMRIDLLVNDFVFKALTDGYLVLYQKHFKRNFVHITDVANAIAYGVDNFDAMKNQVFNLGLDEANMSKLELAELIKRHIPALTILDAEIGEDPDKRNYVVSNEKLRAAGFEASVSLDRGVVELMKGLKVLIPHHPLKNL